MQPIIIDKSGPEVPAIQALLTESCIADKVTRVTRPTLLMRGAGEVLELHPDDSHRWSSGEFILWQFIAAVAGVGTVNLRLLAGHFPQDAHERPYIDSLLRVLFRTENI